MASWVTKVPSWVLPLVSSYTIPDDATVFTGIDFGTLEDGEDPRDLSGNNLTAVYPGLIPNYSLDPEIQPTTTGTQYNLKARKGVGFYGVEVTVKNFDDTKLNKWTFPLTRRKFGYVALSRFGVVVHQDAIDYDKQFIISNEVVGLALNYDDDFSTANLLNSADKFCLTQIDVRLSPKVEITVSFLPIWEIWALRFFQMAGSPCLNRRISTPPDGYVEGSIGRPAPWGVGSIAETNLPGQNIAILVCADPQANSDPVWEYSNSG